MAQANQSQGSEPEVNPRTCIVTGKPGDAAGMIRFVAGPDDMVVADLRRKLPGRGVWVTARHDLVEKAASRNLFARGLKKQVRVPPDLAGEVARLIEKQATSALSMAKKTGAVVSGHAKCDAAIRAGKVALLLHAVEAAPDGIRKLDQAIHMLVETGGTAPAVSQTLSEEQMGLALGGHNVIHAAAMHGGATVSLTAAITALDGYREKKQA